MEKNDDRFFGSHSGKSENGFTPFASRNSSFIQITLAGLVPRQISRSSCIDNNSRGPVALKTPVTFRSTMARSPFSQISNVNDLNVPFGRTWREHSPICVGISFIKATDPIREPIGRIMRTNDKARSNN